MRFAWLRENAAGGAPIKQAGTHPLALIRTAYNLAFWIFLLPFFTSVAYSTGFVVFAAIILIRLLLNLYTNHLFTRPEQYEASPFRIP
ncbi:MAG: hypothetical protein P8129_10390 [Anaerolineae bacterium]|jgi:hypothetical protein